MFNSIKDKFSNIYKTTAPSGKFEYMIVGLGNVGKEYENTRHNAGFMAIDKICDKYNCKADRLKFKSLYCDVTIQGKRILILKPTTFMNKSGEAVMEAMQFYKIPMEKIIVVHDDISLDVGKMRIRRKGSDGGQKGIRNIIYLSGKDTFPRIKIGVGQKPHPDYNLADWVLSKFTKDDIKNLDEMFNNTISAIELIINGETDKAMNKFN